MSREKVELKDFMSTKGVIRDCPMDVRMRNLWQKAERGKNNGSESTTRFPRASCFEKPTRSVPETWGRTYDVLPWSAKGTRKWDKNSDVHAAKKGTKKLVSSNFAMILEEESSNLLPLVQQKKKRVIRFFLKILE
jgi:hypothetical protein